MSITFTTTHNVTKAFEAAKASREPYSVIVVHQTPEDALVCDVHYGAYTTEGYGDSQGPFSWVHVKTAPRRGTNKKEIVASYPVRSVHAVYIVESEGDNACRCRS